MSKFVGDDEEADALLNALGTPDEDDTLESHEHGLTDDDIDLLNSHYDDMQRKKKEADE